jgi:CheY-like chemotaxis protein
MQPLIIACTGHYEDNYVKKAIKSGMNQIISKPVQPELIQKLIHMLGY